MSDAVAVIWKRSLDKEERDLLDALGGFLAEHDMVVHVPAYAENPVGTGYRTVSGEPAQTHKKGLHTAAPTLIAYTDPPLREAVTNMVQQNPDLDVIYIESKEGLRAFVEATAYYTYVR